MRERPIIFTGESVRAIREGRKTQTRRVIALTEFQRSTTPGYDFSFRGKSGTWQDVRTEYMLNPPRRNYPFRCPYGKPGDRLWVRETWVNSPDGIIYRATVHEHGITECDDYEKWKPSIHMPRWASRITLEITGVRVEQLQEIARHPEDAKAEGDKERSGMPEYYSRGAMCHVDWFAMEWDRINGKRAPWASNPWVWVIEFRRVRP